MLPPPSPSAVLSLPVGDPRQDYAVRRPLIPFEILSLLVDDPRKDYAMLPPQAPSSREVELEQKVILLATPFSSKHE